MPLQWRSRSANESQWNVFLLTTKERICNFPLPLHSSSSDIIPYLVNASVDKSLQKHSWKSNNYTLLSTIFHGIRQIDQPPFFVFFFSQRKPKTNHPQRRQWRIPAWPIIGNYGTFGRGQKQPAERNLRLSVSTV